ncbi:hypothetical protein FRC06_009663, partial [Ceratobasidium sp. 370]
MSQPPVRPAGRIRHRIQDITLGSTISKYPIDLKVLVDNVEVFRLPQIAPGQLLHWTSIPARDVLKESEVTIRVYEIHRWGRRRVALAQYKISAIESQREATIASDNPKYTATIVFPDPQP